MRVTLLGTQGWIPTERARDDLLRRRGRPSPARVRRRHRPASSRRAPVALARWSAATEVHLFLTHYHLDHVCGLAYLQAVFPERRVIVHAPHAVGDRRRPGRGPRRPHPPPVQPAPLARAARRRGCGRSATGSPRSPVTAIAVRAQTHSDVSVAYRLDDALVVATDTSRDPATATFAAGARRAAARGVVPRRGCPGGDVPRAAARRLRRSQRGPRRRPASRPRPTSIASCIDPPEPAAGRGLVRGHGRRRARGVHGDRGPADGDAARASAAP